MWVLLFGIVLKSNVYNNPGYGRLHTHTYDCPYEKVPDFLYNLFTDNVEENILHKCFFYFFNNILLEIQSKLKLNYLI